MNSPKRDNRASIPRLALLLFAVTGIVVLVLRIAVDFPKLGESGYPDSYLMYDALHFQRTGVIYRDPAAPPFPPAIYSPMLYVAVSIPSRIVETVNPFLGPRVLVLLAFLTCVACALSITRALLPVRGARPWGFLLASSVSVMTDWVLNIRADFFGVAFSLLSVRLLLSRRRWAPLIAGAAAGMAFQFKITFVAAAVAGTLWLIASKRLRDLLWFVGGGVVVGFGLYGYFELREPQTIARLLSINLAVRDFKGVARFLLWCVTEPVFILAVTAVPVVFGRFRSGWGLLTCFALISLVLATVTATHAGGNINYFFECLFALTPLAVLGALRMVSVPSRWAAGSLVAATLLTLHYTIPGIRTAHALKVNGLGAANRAAERRPIEILGRALPGHAVLSTVPRISLIVDHPLIIEPYFLAYSQRLGRFDSGPIRTRIRAREFEAVITSSHLKGFRGVPAVPADILEEIASSYAPFCMAGNDFVVHIPKGTVELSPLALQLKQLGCTIIDNGGAVARR